MQVLRGCSKCSTTAFKLLRRGVTPLSKGSPAVMKATTEHTISDVSPNHASPYIYIFDTHHGISFIVDTASPRSIVPADIFRDQANDDVSTRSLFASDGYSLAVFRTVTLTLNFEQLSGPHIDHTFIVADVQCSILGNNFLSKHGAIVYVKNKTVTFAKATNADSTVPHLTPLNYDKFFHDDILQLFPNVTSGEFFTAKTILPIEHTFTVSGPPFARAARKLRQLDYMLDNDIIEFSCLQYTSPVHLVPKKNRILSDCVLTTGS